MNPIQEGAKIRGKKGKFGSKNVTLAQLKKENAELKAENKALKEANKNSNTEDDAGVDMDSNE